MRQRADSLLREMLEIYSPAGEEQRIGQYLVHQMNNVGFRAYLDEAGNAIGEMGSGTRTMMLLGHMDTVPGFIPVREANGRLYGRGAVDAKGPLAAFIMAASQYGPPKDAKLILVGAVEEEGCSKGARFIVERYRPDFAVIGEPSGWEHVTLGYKGSLSMMYRVEREHAHPAGEGATACQEAVSFWNRLSAWAEQFNQDKAREFDRLTPKLLSIQSASDAFVDRVEMRVMLRWPLGLELATLESRLRELAGPASVAIDSYEVPYRADKRNPLVRAFLAAIRHCGGEPGFKLKTGTSDMNIVGPAWNCPILAYGPGDSNLDHTPNESIELEEYHRAIEVLGRVLQTL